MASPSTSSSYSSIRPCTYDVFLNFRGEDTRDSFISHLRAALKQRDFNTFVDDKLNKGEEISSELLHTIEDSRASIVVFSPNYASSSWCLNELLKIVSCKETKGQKVLPVFYHVEPTHVRNQTGAIGEALAKFKDHEKLGEWKIALQKVANLSGFPHEKGDECKLIHETLVPSISKLVQFPRLHVTENAIGIESRVEGFLKHLDTRKKKNAPCMAVIWGVGGIGKTTLTKAIYNSIAPDFDGMCFLANVRETTQRGGSKAPSKDGLVELQNRLIYKILGNDTLRSDNVDEGIVNMQKCLHSKKVLLILDDVNHLEQLSKLAGDSSWFGLGSVIIITTRNRGILTSHMQKFEEKFVYKVQKLNDKEALKLFSMKAFGTNELDDVSLELAKEAIGYSGGLPLALTVLGSALYGKDIDFQREKFQNFRRVLNKDIQSILELSINDLEDAYKDVFLDIACFFKGESMKDVELFLSSLGYSPKLCIKELEDRSLIHTRLGIFEMHDLVQDMGREIVQLESPTRGKRSRLWFCEDVRHVLEENTGTIKVKGILIDLPDGDEICIHPKAFNKMNELKLFINQNARISGKPAYLSNELRWLEWPGYHGDSMPSNFHGKALVVVQMPRSKLQSLEIFKTCPNITIMNFSRCDVLQEIPDFSGIPKLKQLLARHCPNLVGVDPSVGRLEELVILDFKECFKLRRFPRILRTRSLERLILHCCPIEKFPEFEYPMESLSYIHLSCTGIEHLPSSFRNLINSTEFFLLDLENCEKLKHFPSGILLSQLEYHGSPYDCLELEKFSQEVVDDGQHRLYIESRKKSKTSSGPRVLPLPLQKWEFLVRCVLMVLSRSSIVSLPACIQSFLSLSGLCLDFCEKLQEIGTLPPFLQILSARECHSLKRFSVNACDLPCLKSVDFSDHCCRRINLNLVNDVERFILSAICEQRYLGWPTFEIRYPGSEILNWFSHCKEASNGRSCEITINETAHVGENFRGIAFCFAFETKDGKIPEGFRIELISGGKKITVTPPFMGLGGNNRVFYFVLPEGFKHLVDTEIVRHWSDFGEFELKWDDIQVHFGARSPHTLLIRCGVHLLYSNEENTSNRCTIMDNYVLHDNKYVPRNSSDDESEGRPLLLPLSKRWHEDSCKYLRKLAREDLVDSNDGNATGQDSQP